MKDNLTNKMYSGRYTLAKDIEDNILNLDSNLIRQANRLEIDLFAVSALNKISSEKEADHFKKVIYPTEIAKKIFPDENYSLLENFALNKTVKVENCGAVGKMNVTPKIISNREINRAYHNVYSVISENNSELEKIKNVWHIK